YRDDRSIGKKDRTLRHRPRSYTYRRIWRGAFRTGAGEMFLSPRSADRARDGVGYALPPRPGMGLFSGAEPGSRGSARDHGGLRWDATSSSCQMSAKAPPRPSLSRGI